MNRIICIPIYHLRRDELMIRLQTSKYRTYLFTSPDDENNYSYLESGQVSIVNTDAHNVAEKHQFILDWCRNNDVNMFIELDDDVRSTFLRITPETKRQTSNSYSSERIDCDIFFDKLFDTMNSEDAAFGSAIRPAFIGFSQPGILHVNRRLNCGQVVCIDVSKTQNINYIVGENINDDVCFVMDCVMNGLKCITLGDHSFMQWGGTSVITETKNARSYMQMNTAAKYHFPIHLDSAGVVRFKILFDKYFDNMIIPDAKDDFNRHVYDMIEQDTDREVVYEFIKKYYNNKKNKNK